VDEACQATFRRKALSVNFTDSAANRRIIVQIADNRANRAVSGTEPGGKRGGFLKFANAASGNRHLGTCESQRDGDGLAESGAPAGNPIGAIVQGPPSFLIQSETVMHPILG
jgi:hypothetical protein